MGHFYELPKELHPDFLDQKKPTGEVEIDWENPITKGLRIAYVPSHAVRDRNINGGFPAWNGTKAPIEQFNGVVCANHGFGTSSTSDKRIALFNEDLSSATETTVFIKSRPNSGADGHYYTAVDHHFAGNRNVGSGFGYFSDLAVGGSPNPAKQTFVLFGVASYTSSATNLQGPDFQTHGVSFTSGQTLRFYADGQQKQSISIGSIIATSRTDFGIGGYESSTGQCPSFIEIAYVFDRDLSATEWAELDRDPYQILKPVLPLLYYIPSAASGRTASLIKALGGLSLSSSAATDLTASVSKSLSALTLASSATLDLQAQLNKTLSDATLVSASDLDIDATLSKTLGALTLDSTATITSGITATLNSTLDALTLSGTCTLDLDASLSKALGSLTLSSSAAVEIDAQLSVTLGALSLDSTAEVGGTIIGTLSSTFDSLSLSSTAELDITSTLAVTLDSASLSSAGTLDLQASLTGTLDDVTLSAFGAGARDAQLTATLDSLALDAAGTVILGRVGFFFTAGETSGDDLGFYDASSDSSGNDIGFFNP